ncbi:MAG: cytochrome c maturation protein CcmE [Gammaproteobacteria bacterium]|nr:cytochrome c maturation protein CcmE [Gammaproteobacteria bacterium]MDH5592938.1 cytochrome c maturation protein CcmE [Gammaproteobacteria bacterium]MDH5613420.1 cytochrome c maturation protein CcmE [Gammaproteobacteria bacterium]
MNPKRKKRLIYVVLIVAGVGAAAALMVTAFQQNMMYFITPTEIAAGAVQQGRSIRLGGVVSEGSLRRENDGLTVHFKVTDNANEVPVRYKGILPDLFREGQGIIAIGKVTADNLFVADEVLAKHDENYMPPEVMEALEKSGAKSPHKPEAK